MKREINFFVDGKPQQKERARFGNGKVYTPKKTVSYERHVAIIAKQAMGVTGLLDGAISVTLIFARPIIKSMSKKSKAAAIEGNLLPVTRPDIDNYTKSALDGMNGIVYTDDSQVCILTVLKIYSEKPGLNVSAQEI